MKPPYCFSSQTAHCRKSSKGTIFQELSALPGISQRTIQSVLLSDCLEEICKCGDAWSDKGPLGSIPFSTDLTEQSLLTEKDLLLQQLMKRLGFFDDDTQMSDAAIMREWLKELNSLYNESNDNSVKHGKGARRRPQKYNLNYLDYSLLKYEWPGGMGGPEGPDLSHMEEDDRGSGQHHHKKKKPKEHHPDLPEDMRDDIKQMQFRLKSFRRSQNKQTLKTLLFYQPYVHDNEKFWKSFDAELGAEGFKDKLNEVGFHPEFSIWSMTVIDYIIKGEPIPYHLFDTLSLKELRAYLNKLLEKNEKPQYDFFGFRIDTTKKKKKSRKGSL